MEKLPERIVWAAGLLNVQPGDRILEIGCGNGAAVYAVSEGLRTGKITAIDRSEKATALAARRNAENLALGKAEIITTTLADADLPARHFDKIFVYNLNVFWMDPRLELALIKELLKPEGKLFIFHQPPPGADTREYAAEFRKNLKANGFEILDEIYNDDEKVRSVCVISRVSRR